MVSTSKSTAADDPRETPSAQTSHVRARLPLLSEQARRCLLAGDLDAAAVHLQQALRIAPDDPGLLAQQAILQYSAGDTDASIESARRALHHDPGEPVAAALLVRQLTDRCLPSQAVDVGRAALERRPRDARVQRALASALLFLGDAPQSLAMAIEAARALPGDAAAVGTALIASLYDDTVSSTRRAELHRALAGSIRPAQTTVPLSPAGDRRLRIGFYSADFRNHPVGQLVRPVLEQLDRTQFEVFCYAQLEHRDQVTEALRTLPLHWRETTAHSDAQVLATMRSDRLDVLVDLCGHTYGGRPGVIRGRAAPVQLGWLGYLGRTGLPEMDGLIADDIVFPGEEASGSGERAWHLPLGMLCLQRPEFLPPVGPLPLVRHGAPTFGSFNHLAKLSDATVTAWSQLLAARPDARLILCAIPLLEEATRTRTQARFAAQGIDPSRVELRPPQPPGEAFLRQYADIDVALDPLAFSGGATTLDALRQGVPVVTLAGPQMHQRTSAGVLQRIGLDDFVASDLDGYIRIALSACQSSERLATLRGQLRSRLSAAPAADADRYTRAVERLLMQAAGRT